METMQLNGLKGKKYARKKSLAVSIASMAMFDLLQALQEERLSSVFSPDGTLISASTAPTVGVLQSPTTVPVVNYLHITIDTSADFNYHL